MNILLLFNLIRIGRAETAADVTSLFQPCASLGHIMLPRGAVVDSFRRSITVTVLSSILVYRLCNTFGGSGLLDVNLELEETQQLESCAPTSLQLWAFCPLSMPGLSAGRKTIRMSRGVYPTRFREICVMVTSLRTSPFSEFSFH